MKKTFVQEIILLVYVKNRDRDMFVQRIMFLETHLCVCKARVIKNDICLFLIATFQAQSMKPLSKFLSFRATC